MAKSRMTGELAARPLQSAGAKGKGLSPLVHRAVLPCFTVTFMRDRCF